MNLEVVKMENLKLIGQLSEIRKMAAEASLTGMLMEASTTLAKHYNMILKILQEKELIEMPEMFPILDEEINMAELGAYAALLMRYLKDSQSKGE